MHAGYMLFCRLLNFFSQLFRKILSRIPLECQTVWIQVRPDLDPNCLQMTLSLVGKELMEFYQWVVVVLKETQIFVHISNHI